MKSHPTTLRHRVLRAGSRIDMNYRVIAVGIDYRGQVISLATNHPLLPNRSRHAEERVLWRAPKSLARIVIARVNKRGKFLPIDPCQHCAKLAAKRGVKIVSGIWE